MSKSKRLQKLLKRLKFLEETILPPERPSGLYSKKEQVLINSYVLLCHAELESYIEDVAKAKVMKSLNDWNKLRRKSNCLKSVISFAGNEISFERDKKALDIQHRINRSAQHYLSLVNMNHGIREKNILDILLPLGIEYDELDNTWINVMDSFGSVRGKLAHTSYQVQQPIDRNSQVDIINNQIVPEIIRIDGLIKKLK